MSKTEMSESSPFTLTLLGPFAVTLTGGEPLPALRSRRGLYLLALLALRGGKPMERGFLAATLWPDSLEAQAAENLRKTLKDLRKALGPDAERLHAPTPRSLALNLSDAQVDVVAFDTAIAQTDADALRHATDLYLGPLLAGWTEDWVLGERQTREERYVCALETLAERETAQSRPALAAALLQRVVAVAPFRESAYRALLTALATDGSYAAATQAYRSLREFLHREINGEPDAETRALYQKLRDQARQKGAEEVPSAPPVDAAPAPPARLQPAIPRPLTSFIGRVGESTRIRALLRDAPLVSLVGIGGVGKTRLATQVARDLTEAPLAPPDGVWFVDLSSLTEPELLPRTLASVLGIREESASSLTDSLLTFLRDRDAVLVFDNCEQIVAACAQLAERLLTACPQLRLLATSRQSLGLAGEVVVPLQPLAAPTVASLKPADKGLVAHLMAYDAVRLFVERASQVNPCFRLTGENADAVAQICQRLDGLPLALELAAARVKVLSAAQIAARLDDRFRLLAGRSAARNVPARQQALLAALDWSYDLLEEAERVLLCRLSRFAGGCFLEAVEAVCSEPDDAPAPPGVLGLEAWEILDLVTALADKSLVIVEPHGTETRFRLLESVRAYGRARLHERGEEDRARRQHADYFCQLAQTAEPELYRKEQAAWLDRLETEWENLRIALDWMLEHDQARGVEFAGNLWRFWDMRGYRSEGVQWLRRVIDQPVVNAFPTRRARFLTLAGALVFHQGDYAGAEAYFTDALALQESENYAIGIGITLTYLGNVALFRGDYPAARVCYTRSLEIKRTLGDERGVAITLYNLASTAAWQGDHLAARPLFDEALAIYRKMGDERYVADTLLSQGSVALHLGDYAGARHLLDEGNALHERLGNRHGCAVASLSLGMLARREAHRSKAWSYLTDALTLSRELETVKEAVECLGEFAHLARGESQPVRATRLLAAALALGEAYNLPVPPSNQGDYDDTRTTAEALLGTSQFAVEWEQGRSLTLEQATQYALERGT